MSNLVCFNDTKLRNQLVAAHNNREAAWGTIVGKKNEPKRLANASTATHTGALHYEDYIAMTGEVVAMRDYPSIGNFYRTMVGAGLTKSVDIGKTLIEFQKVNDFGEATVSMDMANREMEQTFYERDMVPLPVIHKDMIVPWRQQGYSYKSTDGISAQITSIMKTRDRVLMLGQSNIVEAGHELYGYTNHPDTLAVRTTAYSTGEIMTNIKALPDEVLDVFNALYTGRQIGGVGDFDMYVSPNLWTPLQTTADGFVAKDISVYKHLTDMLQINSVQPQIDLLDDSYLLVQRTRETSLIAVANDTIVIPWSKKDPYEDLKFTAMAACAPMIKTDMDGRTGIIYCNPSNPAATFALTVHKSSPTFEDAVQAEVEKQLASQQGASAQSAKPEAPKAPVAKPGKPKGRG